MNNTCYIGGIQRFSTEDGPGIRTTAFVKGCPLNCAWCHNPELISFGFDLMYKADKCIHCGECLSHCPTGALHTESVKTDRHEDDSNESIQIQHRIKADPLKCTGCGTCVYYCGSGALHTKSNEYTVTTLVDELERDRDFFEKSEGGVTFSGGEILSHADFVISAMKECRNRGISVVADTCGYGNYEDLQQMAELSDVILYDLKHMDKERHIELTGRDPEHIWKNLIQLVQDGYGDKVIVRVPFIHPLNDTEKNVNDLLNFMMQHGLKTVNFLPYHSMGISKAREIECEQEVFEAPDDAYLEEVRDLFKSNHLNVVIMGKEGNS